MPALALLLALTFLSVDPSRTLTLHVRGNRSPVVIAYTKYDIHASHQESQRIGDQETGFAVGDPMTITFTFPVPQDQEPSLKLNLNKGREIISLVARDVSAYDVKKVSIEEVRTTVAVVKELKLSGKQTSRTGTLIINCDRVDTSTKIADVL